MPRRGYRKGECDSKTPLTRQVYTRVSQSTCASLRREAIGRRLTVSALMREVLQAHISKRPSNLPRFRGLNDAALRELSRIGNNLNQLAHEAHLMRLPLLETDTRAALEELLAVARRLAD